MPRESRSLGAKPVNKSGTLPFLNAQKQVVIVRIKYFTSTICKQLMEQEMASLTIDSATFVEESFKPWRMYDGAY